MSEILVTKNTYVFTLILILQTCYPVIACNNSWKLHCTITRWIQTVLKLYLTFELQSNYKLVCCLITVKQEECAIAILFAKKKGLQMRCRPFYLATLKVVSSIRCCADYIKRQWQSSSTTRQIPLLHPLRCQSVCPAPS